MSGVKRGMDDGDAEDPSKKMKADDDGKMEIRVLIDNHEASVIIGTGGSNVKMVRDKSSSFVSILKTENKSCKERVMTIKGTEEGICKAVQLIVQLLLDAANKRK